MPEILNLAIVGVVLSVVVQWVKAQLQTSPNETRLLLVLGSGVLAVGWWLVADYQEMIFKKTLEIAVSANAVWGFFIKQLEE